MNRIMHISAFIGRYIANPSDHQLLSLSQEVEEVAPNDAIALWNAVVKTEATNATASKVINANCILNVLVRSERACIRKDEAVAVSPI